MQTFRVTKLTQEAKSFEGRLLSKVEGQWQSEARTIPKGSLYVPVGSRKGLLAMHLLEPQAPDSLVYWGWFNAFLERREYIEDYVIEAEARRMLANDPKLKAAFEKQLKEDPDFSKSADKRLDFFYERHPSFDERYRLYPIYRVDLRP